MLIGVHRRLARLAKTAEDFRDVVGPVWAPKLGAYVCAAHFLEHHLRESPAGLVVDASQVNPPSSWRDASAGAYKNISSDGLCEC